MLFPELTSIIFPHCKAFENFFFTHNTFLNLPILLQDHKDDLVLSTVYKWLKIDQKLFHLFKNILHNHYI